MRPRHLLVLAGATGLALAVVGVGLPGATWGPSTTADAEPAGGAGAAVPAALGGRSEQPAAAPVATAAAPGATAVAPTPAPVAADPVLTAMQRDLGLTADEAIVRVIRDDQAHALDRDLRSRLGEAYAGAYLTEDSGSLTVAVTDPAAAETVSAAQAIPALVTSSRSTLEQTKAALDRAAADAEPRGVTSWFIDVPANTVTVIAGERTAAAAFISAAGVDPATTTVVTSDEQPQTLADVRGGDAYYINGTSRCSVGFSVEGGYVTAGHCGSAGSSTAGVNRANQGVVQGSQFPGHDWGWVRVNANWTPQPWVRDAAGGNVQVAGSEEAVIGAAVCRSGSTTGWRCGTILAKNATVMFPQGTVTGLTRTNACAERGDSGGSWISGQQAQGVTSGGNGNCSVGGTTYFQPINPILATYGLSLRTTGSVPATPPPAPTTPAPTTPAPASPTPATPSVTVPAPTTPATTPAGPPAGTPTPTTAAPITPGTTAPVPTVPVPTTPSSTPTQSSPAGASRTPTPAPAELCRGYGTPITATIGRARYAIAPASGSFRVGSTSTRSACLAARGPADIRLYLQKWLSGRGWVTVGLSSTRSTGSGPVRATMRRNASVGTYRYVIYLPTGGPDFAFAAR
ncbi:MAG: alpha-lytic protease prodomain-containing protein [Kineosporiaceae bacterium]|nr:alpha-lytic protease prodomain-containing protein [Kineosporiaceae bacterium]